MEQKGNKKSEIKLNKFWKYAGKIETWPGVPEGYVYIIKEKYFRLINKIRFGNET